MYKRILCEFHALANEHSIIRFLKLSQCKLVVFFRSKVSNLVSNRHFCFKIIAYRSSENELYLMWNVNVADCFFYLALCYRLLIRFHRFHCLPCVFFCDVHLSLFDGEWNSSSSIMTKINLKFIKVQSDKIWAAQQTNFIIRLFYFISFALFLLNILLSLFIIYEFLLKNAKNFV